MSKPILEIKNFSKRFRSHWTFRPIDAVHEVTLDVQRGESFGFLGHNGAGKTTTIKSIVGLIQRTGGEILIDGSESSSPENRKKLGYLPEHPYFYDHLTVQETLDFFAALQEIPRAERADRVAATLKRVGLDDRAKASVRSLSKGLQQRLGVAQAIVHEPELLLLDEPFSGLDPIGRHEIRQLVLELKSHGTTIFLSSHILADVEDICDRVSIMSRGELKTVFHLKEAPERFGEAFELTVRAQEREPAALKPLEEQADTVRIEETVVGFFHVLRFSDYQTALSAVASCNDAGLYVEKFERSGLSLEEIFIKITGSESAPHQGPTEAVT